MGIQPEVFYLVVTYKYTDTAELASIQLGKPVENADKDTDFTSTFLTTTSPFTVSVSRIKPCLGGFETIDDSPLHLRDWKCAVRQLMQVMYVWCIGG